MNIKILFLLFLIFPLFPQAYTTTIEEEEINYLIMHGNSFILNNQNFANTVYNYLKIQKGQQITIIIINHDPIYRCTFQIENDYTLTKLLILNLGAKTISIDYAILNNVYNQIQNGKSIMELTNYLIEQYSQGNITISNLEPSFNPLLWIACFTLPCLAVCWAFDWFNLPRRVYNKIKNKQISNNTRKTLCD